VELAGTVTPRSAATVVLLRDQGQGLEVFLVRRHREIAFMGGAHVFPGGRVEERDCDERYRLVTDGVDRAASRMPDVDERLALGFHVAAVRETFEEAGLLLARDGSGASVPLGVEPDVAALRTQVDTGEIGLIDVLQRRQWRLALGSVEYFAHWVTPAIETRRFDTRFFLAAAPSTQRAAHDRRETTDGEWLQPADAIARCSRGEIALPPPTWTTLRWLEAFDRVGDAIAWAGQKTLPRIEPGFIDDGESRLILLPGDRDMSAVDGFEARETRFLLSDGRWTPI
jgi:8-oxo-dGTP pyrophosphatase MutT (NUDIX family)